MHNLHNPQKCYAKFSEIMRTIPPSLWQTDFSWYFGRFLHYIQCSHRADISRACKHLGEHWWLWHRGWNLACQPHPGCAWNRSRHGQFFILFCCAVRDQM